jgi:glycosyltransferase involved in cell wall biosynthesis
LTAFSILLPTHNRPEVLHLAIRSVLAQTRTDWELLVVGDGCTDNTAQVVQGFADPRIRWFDLPKGPGFGYANRNIALRQAKGELIAFLGHDNLYFPDHLEKLAAAFARPKVQFAVARPLFIDDDGTILPFFANLQIPPVFREFTEVRNFLPATAIMHRRSAFDRVGMWPEREEGSGDWDLWKRILADCGRPGVAMVDQPTCLHFRANWRRQSGWGPTPARWLRAVRDSDGWWPKGLGLGLTDGPEMPQQQVWAMLSDQPALVAQIRDATNRLRDHLAWTAGLDPAFR